VLLLVTVIVVGGVAGCSRQAEVREAPETEPVATEAADLQTAEPVEPAEEVATAGPQETVVSALTAVPEGATDEGEATPAETVAEPGTGTPAAVDSIETTVAPTPATVTGAEGQYVVHRVKKGETLSALAACYGVSVRAIRKANELGDSNLIRTGQKLNIPAQGDISGGAAAACRVCYTVKRGQTIAQIAAAYGVSADAVRSANNLTANTTKKLTAGQVLCIP